MENYENMKRRAEEADKNIKHICSENPNCKKVERCTTAIECTTIENLLNGERKYLKGLGECEY